MKENTNEPAEGSYKTVDSDAYGTMTEFLREVAPDLLRTFEDEGYCLSECAKWMGVKEAELKQLPTFRPDGERVFHKFLHDYRLHILSTAGE